ncbi:MAG: hypothetical protein HY758_02105, partial [Nitrospirae bacterium]|nr:hypothetical protein [Nitrospirota bacterium]
TPKTWFNPEFSIHDKGFNYKEGYMVYVDMINETPAVAIMKNSGSLSSNIGVIQGVPHGLLQEALNCSKDECISGMYPITKKIEEWLKKELGLV